MDPGRTTTQGELGHRPEQTVETATSVEKWRLGATRMNTNKIESKTLALSFQHTLNPTSVSTSNRYAILGEDANYEATVLQRKKN